jgi:uncharacterized protein
LIIEEYSDTKGNFSSSAPACICDYAVRMTRTLLNETFSNEALHPLLKWMNPPQVWRVEHSRSQLVLEPDGETDFWQQTHYGFRADNGHFLYAEVPGDCIATAGIRYQPAHQYDQAGLMARFSAECWLKTSTEFEPDAPSHLGAVVTNSGFSDWSLQDFPYRHAQPDGIFFYCLRLRREGQDFLVEHAPDEGGPWNTMRIAQLSSSSGQPGQIGLYACCPKRSGCRVDIGFFRIEVL